MIKNLKTELLDEKFNALEAGNAPGQEVRQDLSLLDHLMKGDKIDGYPVDFSHGDVDAFPPTPDSESYWLKGFKQGGSQAYTEYRGAFNIRTTLAKDLSLFTKKPILADKELILTPGTQGALFLALGATVATGTKVAVVEPDYFANRKLVKFFGGIVVPIALHYLQSSSKNGLDLNQLEIAFKNGTKVLVFSTPNNPTGLVYSKEVIDKIAVLANNYKVTVIVDQLYSRMLYSGEEFTHLRSCKVQLENLITIMGPSKTESLSGYRLGAAFGTASIIDRMERLQAIVSLRASGYNQAVFKTWFNEPKGWLEDRIIKHEAIRDDLLKVFRDANLQTATPQAGSYLFPKLPALSVDLNTFVRLLRYQANVIVTPASEFAPHLNDSIRLNFSQDHKAAIEAAKRIVKMVKIYAL
ncbi:pyridoxal phosphate-dependent aminotransferase [Algibacter pectinivorans]|uniref:Aspartate/methionine/tyrosine aminotransferase n=1 Tax=Algibacter pectinivorans TaxID=870482 RepID=A0A1I1RKI8_9FLAO|nr:pyridoxal phosphate-dependent aminotransferase [Algibacter pectinivorans]SFD34804.1 Aspartate/methionine/tyrosine aminotransferase [Algibacter pectinivorans]